MRRQLPAGLSVLIPAFEEETTLPLVVARIRQVLASVDWSWELLVVDDGSRDGTARVARALATAEGRLRLLSHPCNLGSGAAIASGLAAARYRHAIYVPADGQFDVDEIRHFYRVARREGAAVVVGARVSRDDYTLFRHLSSRVFLALCHLLFGPSLSDVNWVHLWDRQRILSLGTRSRGVFFLEETLVRCQDAGHAVREIPSRYIPRQGGEAKGARAHTILRTVADMALFALARRLTRGSRGVEQSRESPA